MSIKKREYVPVAGQQNERSTIWNERPEVIFATKCLYLFSINLFAI